MRGRHSVNVLVGRESFSRMQGKVAGDIFIVDFKPYIRQRQKRFQPACPYDSVDVHVVEEQTCAHRITRKQQRSRAWIPEGESEVADDSLRESKAPSVIGGHNYGTVAVISSQLLTEQAYQLLPVVESSIPGENAPVFIY